MYYLHYESLKMKRGIKEQTIYLKSYQVKYSGEYSDRIFPRIFLLGQETDI